MNELETKIQKYYQDFKRDFREENFPQVFDLIESYNRSPNRTQHKLGSFVIFYTPIRYKPKLMIIGNNPSWFDKDDPEKGYEIVKGLMKGPPRESSYLVHNHVFANRLQDAFVRIGRVDLLRDCVGMNRWWLQTGPENASWNRACRSNSFKLGQSFISYCESKTRELVSHINPKVTLLVGRKAQKLFPEKNPSNTSIRHVAYPLGGGITQLESDLKKIVEEIKL